MSDEKRTIFGYGRRMDVDLSSGKIGYSELDPELVKGFVGGMGLSCKILYDEVEPDVDPFSPENRVIIASGALTGTSALCASRTEITTKHPLTGHLGSGNTGGTWGAALKRAGFDVVVLRGRAAHPVYLSIDDGECELREARDLWGEDTYKTTEALERISSSPVKVLAVGPAGENLVRFACPINDYYHCAARNGSGAVMGSKNLKAIAVHGSGVVRPAQPDAFRAAVREARHRASEYEQVVAKCWSTDRGRGRSNPDGAAYVPGRNFQTSVTPNWEGTRDLASTFKHVVGLFEPCHACPSPCFKGAEIKEGKYAGVKVSRCTHLGVVIDWGSKCAIDNLPAIWKCKQLCNQLGLDYASTCGVLAFAMELFQRGIVTRQDTDGLELRWGNEDAIVEMLPRIARRQGFGGVLAEGSVRAAKVIGKEAEKYVMATKGMEMMQAQDPRFGRKGWCLGDLTNPRGGDNIKSSHFFADGYEPLWWVDKFDIFEDVKAKAFGVAPEKIGSAWEGKAMMVKWFEDLYSMANALGICFFPVGMAMVLGPTHFSKLLSAFTGKQTSPEDIVALGERVFTVLKAFTAKHGLTRYDDRWPDRFYDEPLPDGPRKGAVVSRDKIDEVLDEYYKLRGWNPRTGLPTEEKLIALGLAEIAEDLARRGKR